MKKLPRVALVRVNGHAIALTPPLGIGYLSSYLKMNGYDVFLIDALQKNLNETNIFSIIQSNNINVLGISCMSTDYSEVVKLSRFVKEHDKEIKIVIGGVHPTFLPYQTLLESRCDYVICGEGEKAFTYLLDNNFEVSNKDIAGVYSLKELTGEEIPFEKAEPVFLLDDLPFPDWEQMQPKTYSTAPRGVFYKKFPIAPIMTTRGCPYPCKFCAAPNFYDRKIRFRSAKNVVDEIKLLVNKYKVKEIHFEDDNLTVNRQHIVSVCEQIQKNNIKISWACPNGIRADKIDNELVKLMKKSGFYSCALGIESANADILKKIDKMESIDTINNAINILRTHKIEVTGFFIFGLPGETVASIKETIDFALKSKLTRALFGIFSVLPGCDFYKELKNEYISDLTSYSFFKPEYIPNGLTIEKLFHAKSSAMKKFYFRPHIIFSLLRYIKFSHFLTMLKRLKSYRLLKS